MSNSCLTSKFMLFTTKPCCMLVPYWSFSELGWMNVLVLGWGRYRWLFPLSCVMSSRLPSAILKRMVAFRGVCCAQHSCKDLLLTEPSSIFLSLEKRTGGLEGWQQPEQCAMAKRSLGVNLLSAFREQCSKYVWANRVPVKRMLDGSSVLFN